MADIRPQLVLLTSGGRGAIATLRVEGPGALDVVAAVLNTTTGDEINTMPTSNHPRLAILGPPPGEEVIACIHSPQAIELHTHGGHSAVERARQLLLAQGCHEVSWQAWITQSGDDPIRAAAHRALADARTERTAAILLDQYQGALRAAIHSVLAALQGNALESAARQLRRLLDRSSLGRHLTIPWKVVVAGPPNAGKSSLVNALLGYARAIVTPTAGTTRDVVSTMTALEGWPIELSDTAGLHPSEQPLEQAGMELARRQISLADLAILVFDVNQPWSEQDNIVLSHWPKPLVVHNKADLPPHPTHPLSTGICVSAVRGDGLEELSRQIAARLVPEPPVSGEPIPFAEEIVSALERALIEVLAGSPEEAVQTLAGPLR